MPMYIQLSYYKVFHVKHCMYNRHRNCSQLHPLVLPQLMHL